jgi:immunity protein, SdpI family
MRVNWRVEWALWLILAGMFLLAALNWNAVPDRIPVHWGLSGQPDRWGGRFEGLLLLPLIALAIYLILLFIPRIDPGRANYASFAKSYVIIRVMILLSMVGIQVLSLLAARGHPVNMSNGVPPILGVVFVILGNLFGKIRPNWFVGIRTPWTLSSKRSWDRTHRAGGWVFILLGLLLLSVPLVPTPAYAIAVFVMTGLGVLGLVVYSYLVWKDDPDKTPPAGTLPSRE